MYTVCSWPPCT